MLPTFYALATQYRALALRLSEMDIDAETVADTIEASGITDELAAKAQGIVFVQREFSDRAIAIDAEIERLKVLKRHTERTIAGLSDYLLRNMQAAQISRIDGPLISISISKNAPAVEVFDPLQVPTEYMRQPPAPPPAPDKPAIADALKQGIDVPGCKLVQRHRLVTK